MIYLLRIYVYLKVILITLLNLGTYEEKRFFNLS